MSTPNNRLHRAFRTAPAARVAPSSVANLNPTIQRVVCGLTAALIVFTGVSLGVYGASAVTHPGYSVTITQIQ